MKKLRNRRGETLLETLVATLIFTFGSIILLTMISAAAKINDAVKRADDKFYLDMTIVEKAEFFPGVTPTGSVSILISDTYTTALEDTAAVYISQNPAGGLYAYYPAEGGDGP